MDLEVRVINADEVDEWIRSLHIPFLAGPDEDSRRRWRAQLETERAWLALDEARTVGNCCVFTRDVTLPGSPGEPSPTAPMAAISGVGVHTTHRRRGLLRRMMGAMHLDAMARGEPIAGLLASEAPIYGRFGYGWATSTLRVTLPRHTTHVIHPAPELDLKIVGAEDAMDHLPALFDRLRANRAGQVNRNETYWADMLASTRRRSGGSSERFFAIGEHGYTSYRATNNFSSDPTILRVDDLFGVSAEVEAGLWQYILNVDLVDSIVANRPLDESIRWRLEDPRSLTVSGLHDFLWIRVLDVAGALTARRYRTDGRLVFEVEPSTVWPDADGQPGSDPAAGRWVLEAGPSGSSCRRARANEPAELVMGVAELGAALLGGQDLMSRSLAGRVTELKPGALVRADSLLGTRPLPFSSTGF